MSVGVFSFLHYAVVPVAVRACSAIAVYVVDVAHQRNPCLLAHDQPEHPAKIPVGLCLAVVVVNGQSSCRLGMGQISEAVLPFQLHVHHVVLLLQVTSCQLAQVRALVEHLNLLHRVIWQVFQHHLVLALEEILAVERQVVHLAPVDGYLARLGVQLHSVHLLQQSVEHRAVGYVEGVGVVHQCVATVGYPYLCCRYHHFVQLVTHVIYFFLFLLAPHVVPWCIEVFVAPDVFHVEVHVSILVVWMLSLYDELLWFGRHYEPVVRVEGDTLRRAAPHAHGVHDGAVSIHYGNLDILNAVLGKRVPDMAPYRHRTLLAVLLGISVIRPPNHEAQQHRHYRFRHHSACQTKAGRLSRSFQLIKNYHNIIFHTLILFINILRRERQSIN